MDMLDRTTTSDRTPSASTVRSSPAAQRLALPPVPRDLPRSHYVPVLDPATGKVRLEISWTW